MKRVRDILCEIHPRMYRFFMRKKSDVTNYLTRRQDFDKTFAANEKTLPLSEKYVSEGKYRGTFP